MTSEKKNRKKIYKNVKRNFRKIYEFLESAGTETVHVFLFVLNCIINQFNYLESSSFQGAYYCLLNLFAMELTLPCGENYLNHINITNAQKCLNTKKILMKIEEKKIKTNKWKNSPISPSIFLCVCMCFCFKIPSKRFLLILLLMKF